MRFSPSFLDDIRGRLTLSSVLGRKLQWDKRKSHPAKGDFWACCPFHQEKSASFHVDDRKGRYHCFGCKKSGDMFTYLVECEGVPFPEAVAQLAQEAGLALPARSEADVVFEEKRTSLYEVMEKSAKFFEAELQSARGARARGYLADRLLGPALQQEFRLGYAPDERGALRNHLAAQGILPAQMEEAGLIATNAETASSYDRFRDRIIFPIRDARGRVIAFGGRALKADSPAKYLNSPETPLFHKGQVLYNIDKARGAAHTQGSIIAVEGYVDVMAVTRAGLPHVVAPLGTALTPEQLEQLWKLGAEPILCFDGDNAGIKAAYRALDMALPLLKPGYSLRFALLPEGQDPDDLLKQEGPQAVQGVMEAALPLSEVLWQRAIMANDRSTPERRAQFEKELRSQFHEIHDEAVRRHYLADLSDRLKRLWAPAQGALPATLYSRSKTPYKPLKKGGKPWDVAMAPSLALKALTQSGPQAVTSLKRRQGLILLGLMNHPQLLVEFLDDLLAIDRVAPELDALRLEMINVLSMHQSLENEALKCQLLDKGYGSVVNQLEIQAKRLNEWYLGSAAAQSDARTGLRQLFALQRKTVTLDREIKGAEAAYVTDPTDENLKTLAGLRDQWASTIGSEALVPGFGTASGRQSDSLS